MGQSDTTALRPEVFTIPGYLQGKPGASSETDVAILTQEEQILASGADNRFWQILQAHVNNEMQLLDQLNDQAITSGMSVEEIGRNAIVISQVKQVLRKIIHVVTDAKEAADARTTQPEPGTG